MPNHEFTVEESQDHQRLDVFLTNVLPDVPSRSFIKRIIDDGRVQVNGQTKKANHKVVCNDQVSIVIEGEDYPNEDILPEDISLEVFYQDEDVLIVNKPAGMTVHPHGSVRSGTLVNALLGLTSTIPGIAKIETNPEKAKFCNTRDGGGLSNISGPERPGIVHRLDKETSGLMVVVKHNVAHEFLAGQFRKHKVFKQYVALAKGHVEYNEGVIEAPIGPHRKFHDQRQICTDGSGKEAVTKYRVISRLPSSEDLPKRTLIALYPQTGRTHQLRLHMKHLGFPILGDDKYGDKHAFERLALHAQSLGFTHPANKQYIEFSSTTPSPFLT